jgi:hypothetical protein
VDAVGISRSLRDFQTPVGAFSASTGVAASTSRSSSLECESRRTMRKAEKGGYPDSHPPRENRSWGILSGRSIAPIAAIPRITRSAPC